MSVSLEFITLFNFFEQSERIIKSFLLQKLIQLNCVAFEEQVLVIVLFEEIDAFGENVFDVVRLGQVFYCFVQDFCYSGGNLVEGNSLWNPQNVAESGKRIIVLL